jgi:hypothetical protein
MINMKSQLPQSWQERLAIINEFKIPNSTAISLFATTEKELQTARGLVEKGMLKVPQLTADQRSQWQPHIPSAESSTTSAPIVNTTIQSTPMHVQVKAKPQVPSGAKRGRQGTKIVVALSAIPTTPQPVDTFVKQYGVSKTILRQSKRFLDEPIKVSIKRDKSTGIEMICRVV